MAPVTSVQNFFAILCWNLTYAPQLASYDSRDPSLKPCAMGGTPLAVPIYPAAASYNHHSVAGTAAAGNENGTLDAELSSELDSRDKHALLYIVVVLLFYSTGIIVAIVMYLKREKAEIEEEKAYDDYASFRADPDRWARYFRVQRMVAQLDRVEKEAAEKRRLLLQQQQAAAGCSGSPQQQQQQRHHRHLQKQQQQQQQGVQEQRHSTKRLSTFGRFRHRSNSSTLRVTSTTVAFCAAVAPEPKHLSSSPTSDETASVLLSAAAAGDGTPIVFPGLLPVSTPLSAASPSTELLGPVMRATSKQVHGRRGGGAVGAGRLVARSMTAADGGQMKASRSANGRLDACCGGSGGSTDSPVLEATPPIRARSCSPTHQLLSVGEPAFSLSPSAVAESTKTRLSLQVSDV